MLAWVLTGLVLAAPPAVSVAPIQGKGSEACTKAVRDIAAEHAPVEPWHAKNKVRPPASWNELERWLGERQNELSAEIVVLGVVAGPRLVLEAYDPKKRKLIGLRRVTTAKRCMLGARSKEVLEIWFKELVVYARGGAPPVVDLPFAGREHLDPHAAEEAHAKHAEAEEHARGADLLGGHPETNHDEQKKVIDPHPPIAEPHPPRVVPPARKTIAIELGLAVLSRSFSYEGALTPNLRAFSADAMPAPSIMLEATPLAGAGIDVLQPLFVGATFAHAVGVKASRPDGGPDHDATYFDLDVRAGYRIVAPRFSIAPFAGYHRTHFTLGVAGGVRERDLPATEYGCLELGLGAEVPVRGAITAFGGASYLVVISGGEVFSRAFFANGSALGLELDVGARIEIIEGVSAVIAAAHQRYSLTLGESEDDRRIAASAVDSSFSVRSALRLEL